MNENRNQNLIHLQTLKTNIDAIALFGYNLISHHLSRLFSSVGLKVYLILSKENNQISFSSNENSFFLLNEREDLPYLSSVLINCQNDLESIETCLNLFPTDYKQRMAYIECSTLMKENQLEKLYQDMKFTHYLCMTLIELETSTMIQPHIHLICSGDQIVYEKLIFQTKLPAKVTFLKETKSPFDSFHIGLFYRFSQAIHWMIYSEMMATFQRTNITHPENLQYLIDWSYIKRPLMRQLILQSTSSSFTLTTIDEFQLLLESIIDILFSKENSTNHIQNLTLKIYQFVSNLDRKQKEKPMFELFKFY